MSLKNLSDQELTEFIKDPHKFVKDSSNFEKVFGLSDPDLKKRIAEVQAKLGPKPK